MARSERAAPATGSTVALRSPFATSSVDGQIEQAIGSINRGESRALSTAATISPGVLASTLFDRLRASSVVLKTGIKTLEIEGDSVTYPALTADAAPAWTSEAATITPSDPTFSVVGTPRKLAALVQVSNEVLGDAIPSLSTTLTNHLMTVLGLKLDVGLLEGTGTAPEIRGLKNMVGIQTVSAGTNGATPTLDVFADAIAALEAVNVPRERIRIVAAPRNIGTLRKLKASTGGTYLWSSDPSATSPASVFGVPVAASAQLSLNETQGTSGAVADSAYAFDVDSLVYVQRTPIEIEVDRSRLFNSDQSEFRAKLRGDLIARARPASSASPACSRNRNRRPSWAKTKDPDEIVHLQVGEDETVTQKTSRTVPAPPCRSGAETSTGCTARSPKSTRTRCPRWRGGEL